MTETEIRLLQMCVRPEDVDDPEAFLKQLDKAQEIATHEEWEKVGQFSVAEVGQFNIAGNNGKHFKMKPIVSCGVVIDLQLPKWVNLTLPVTTGNTSR